MKNLFLSLLIVTCGYLQAQSDKYWAVHKETTNKIVSTDKAVARKSFPKVFDLYDLNTTVLRNTLFSTFKITNKKSVIISLPNTEGKFEQFEMVEASNFEPTLQTEFSEIRAYSGKGITDK